MSHDPEDDDGDEAGDWCCPSFQARAADGPDYVEVGNEGVAVCPECGEADMFGEGH